MILDDIIDLLSKEDLTAIEVAEKLGIDYNRASSYINTLYKRGKVTKIDKDMPCVYRAITPLFLLGKLMDIMEKMEFTTEPSEYDIWVIKTINEIL